MVRSEARARDGGGILFDIEGQRIDEDALRGVDAVVHLAGEPIAGLRWTEQKKRAILESRVKGTELLARTMAQLRDGPETLVMASAVGFYGDRGDAILDEKASKGTGFLADVVEAWEGAARRAEGSGLRVAKIRLGVVLSPNGGALGTMLPAFRAGVAGRLGSGRQYMPWIDLDDVTGLFHHGPPQPVGRPNCHRSSVLPNHRPLIGSAVRRFPSGPWQLALSEPITSIPRHEQKSGTTQRCVEIGRTPQTRPPKVCGESS